MYREFFFFTDYHSTFKILKKVKTIKISLNFERNVFLILTGDEMETKKHMKDYNLEPNIQLRLTLFHSLFEYLIIF